MWLGGGSRQSAGRAALGVGRPLSKALEGELRADLNVTRHVPLRAVEAEVGVGRVGAQIDEVRVVEGVDGLAPDLEALTLAQPEVLRERQIDAREGHVAQVVQRRREGAQARRAEPEDGAAGEGRTVGVDEHWKRPDAVLLPGPVALTGAALHLGDVTGVEEPLREQDGLPLLPLVGAVELPAADEG